MSFFSAHQGAWHRTVNTGQNSFHMEQEEILVLVSNGYLYRHRVGDVGEAAKRQDGGNRKNIFNCTCNFH